MYNIPLALNVSFLLGEIYMNQTFTLKEKTKQIFIMLIPILITQLGMFSMVFFNTIMSGKYSSSRPCRCCHRFVYLEPDIYGD